MNNYKRTSYMPKYLIIFLFSLVVLINYGCEKIPIPEEPSTSKKTSKPIIENSNDDNTTITVKEALQKNDEICTIKGYIIGSIPTHKKINQFVTTPPFNHTNIVLADSPLEKNPQNCMPIFLPEKDNIRSSISLFLHPENLHIPILIQGQIVPYYGTLGIKKPFNFQILTDKDLIIQDTIIKIPILPPNTNTPPFIGRSKFL